MEAQNYIQNMQKLLFVARELHNRDFGNLYVIPSMSPSGAHWRCIFRSAINTEHTVIGSNWIQDLLNARNNNYYTIEEITDRFIADHRMFVKRCIGKNQEYSQWFATVVANLDSDELPYAFSDYFSEENKWQTTKGKLINTLD